MLAVVPVSSKKRSCTFNSKLEREFKFIKVDGDDRTKVICQLCHGRFSVAHGGRSDINQHLRSKKHINSDEMTPASVKALLLAQRDIAAEKNKISKSKARKSIIVQRNIEKNKIASILPIIVKAGSEDAGDDDDNDDYGEEDATAAGEEEEEEEALGSGQEEEDVTDASTGKDLVPYIVHQYADNEQDSSKAVVPYVVKQNGDEDKYKIAASEAVIAYHTVHHGQSFRENDCLSTLIKKIYEPKFSSARTRSEEIIVNVLSPYILDELKRDLQDAKSISLSIDGSNKKNSKLFPVIVRYFLPDRGVQIKVMEFTALPDDTADVQTALLKKISDNFALQNKIVALCANSTNTNFGCERIGKNNVCVKLEAKLKREMLSIGCGAQIVNNCLQCAVDCLPIDVESFVFKVYNYFNVYTVRFEELRNFCEFAETNYVKLLEHGDTRILALGQPIDRILKVFEGLRSYFLYQEKCPVTLRLLFENPCLKLWVTFVKDQISMLQGYICAIERDSISATEVAWLISDLVNDLQLRKTEIFVTSDVKKLLKSLVYADKIDEAHFFQTVEEFYHTTLEYINEWRSGFGNAEKFKWVMLKKVPEWADVQNSLDDEFITRTETDEACVFDQWTLIRQIIARLLSGWTEENVPVSERWVQVFLEMIENGQDFRDFSNVVEYVLCLPGSSTPVEKLFSVVNTLWSAKTRLSINTMRAMLIVRQNCVMDCERLYDKVLMDKNLLHRILSTERCSSWYGKAKKSFPRSTK